ncbi:MlaD family protein [Terrimonas pollutisoli]|uniref:MlaD family protein n=1 Tax=Terrimonas pollutisoli TaxID=3034147 RepID=UPI0023EC5EF6|nr:MlaD family protein [Terrimonas sp. H1YJ31]
MKIKNETKVGVLTVVALALLIIGFNFLKGKDIFNNTTKIYAVFSKLGSLAKSNEVKINGLTVGTVYAMEETDKNVSGIKVTISLTRDVNIPSNSVAYITAPLGGLGSSSIIIEKGDAATYLKDGDVMQTRIDEGLFGGLSAEVSPTLSKIRNSLDSLNRVFGNINSLFDAGAKRNLQHTIANLDMATSSLNRILDPQNSALASTLNNVNAITGNLKNNNDSITAIVANTKQFTDKLSKLDLQQTMDTLQAAMTQLKATITKISSKDGSLGALINDRQLYNKLTDAILSAEILIDDLRAHPKRYVNLSIFGKKDKGGALTSPLKKDTVPR